MKKIFTFSVMLLTALVVRSTAATSKTVNRLLADTVHKKIVHPTVAMTDAEIKDILNAMKLGKSDDDKIVVLKKGVKDKGIKIDQLITLLNQFLLDDSKLACAEYAFPYTVNYKAFLEIMDLFSQEGYKYKLEDFYDKNKK